MTAFGLHIVQRLDVSFSVVGGQGRTACACDRDNSKRKARVLGEPAQRWPTSNPPAAQPPGQRLARSTPAQKLLYRLLPLNDLSRQPFIVPFTFGFFGKSDSFCGFRLFGSGLTRRAIFFVAAACHDIPAPPARG